MDAIILVKCTAEEVCKILSEINKGSSIVSVSFKDIPEMEKGRIPVVPPLPQKVEKGRWTGTRYVYSHEENDLIAQMVKQGATNSEIRRRMIENNPDYRFTSKQIENKVGSIRRALNAMEV